MTSEKTFFSYSRNDSDFVLKLATNLRDAGVNIWLDQLDIPAGKRWDTEIEKALENSQIQLVILSPSAVVSQNCMDEVSYALEKNMRVIPILLKECQIPFRLRRVHYIDFTADFESAFNKLLKAFDPDTTPASFATTQGLTDQDFKLKGEKEEILWNKVTQSKSEELSKKYLDEYPAGKYAKEAKQNIKKFKKERRKSSYIKDKKGNLLREKRSLVKRTLTGLIIASIVLSVIIVIYLNTESEQNITGENIYALEEQIWNEAVSANSISAYESYLGKFPDGKFSKDAKTKIKIFIDSRKNDWIAFSSDVNGVRQIYIMKADGSEQTCLTNDKSDNFLPFWSADGNQILFSSNRKGNWEIYIMNSDGGKERRLTDDNFDNFNPSLSPDGSRIAFDSDRNGSVEIYVMNADGSEINRITNYQFMNHQPSWSPDGKWITFSSNRDGNWEIYFMMANGSKQNRLTNNSLQDVEPSWSPNGSQIAFSSNRDGKWEIYIMNTDGSNQTRLTNNKYGNFRPSWSPDGSRIAFSSNHNSNWEIYIMNIDGSDVKRLIEGRNPTWAKLGK